MAIKGAKDWRQSCFQAQEETWILPPCLRIAQQELHVILGFLMSDCILTQSHKSEILKSSQYQETKYSFANEGVTL